jgi:hypothetical protein
MEIFNKKCIPCEKKNRFIEASGENSNAFVYSNVWKMFLNLNVLNVLKTFIWKACNYLASTKENIFLKKMITNDYLCPICGVEV